MKKLASLLFCVGLCVGLSTCLAAGSAYEEAVAGLREVGYGTYREEQTYDSDLCTLFSYSVLAPHGPYANLALVYKAGSPLGEGAVVSLPVPDQNAWGASSAPETLTWDPEGGQLTYSYYFDTPIYTQDFSSIRREAGTFLYTVNLTTGEVTETLIPPTYEDILEQHFPEDRYAREQVLEAPGTTVLLLRQTIGDGGYSLHLVDKAETSDHRVRDLILPSTVVLDAYPNWFPTDRAPDRLSLSEDGKTLTYVYSFPDQLVSPYDGVTLHEAGTYTYTVDMITGELEVAHTDQVPTPPQPPANGFADVPAGSWFEKGALTCAGNGVMVGTGRGTFSPERELTAAECLTLAVRLYDLRRGGNGGLRKTPEEWGKYTLTLADGTTWTRYGEQNDFFGSTRFDGAAPGGGDLYAVFVLAPGDTAREREDWAKAHQGPAVLTAEGRTYSGTVTADSTYDGPCLRFSCGEVLHTDELISNCKPGPDRWYRDAVYTAEQLGLREADGFTSLLAWLATYSPDTGRADREAFAKALAVAAGELEKRYDVTIPDVERRESTEGIYALYESGVLNGTDSFGTFQMGKRLTRAEAAVMVARVLDPTQRLSSPPAAPNAYEQAVIELRGSWEYRNEQTFEAPDCTIFVYDPGGIMQRSYGVITLIYKPGSQLGAGTVIGLPHARVQYSVMGRPADTMTLSEDGRTFTYTYYRPEDIVGWVEGVNEGEVLEKAGAVTYTVDLPTGTVTERFDPPNYQAALAHVSKKRIITPSEHSEDREVVETLEADQCTAVLTKGRFVDQYDDYILSLVYKPGSALGDGTIKQLILPTTVIAAGYWRDPTDRAPDSLFLSAGGTKLVYAYDFSERLAGEETVYHEAGRYTYTVDLKTGELSVDAPIKPDNIGDAYGSYQQAIDGLKNGPYPLSVDRQLETESCSLLMGHVSAPHGGYYVLKLVFKAGSQPGDGMVVGLPQPRINFWDNGAAPTTLEFSEDQRFLTYTYHFDEPAEFDGSIFHEAGDYTYTVDLHTGVVAEDLLPGSYEEALARCLREENYTVERSLEGPFCTALLRYSHVDESGLAHQREGRKDYELTLVYKAGTGLPEGTLRSPGVPYTFAGITAVNGLGVYVVADQAPDSMAFSGDGKQFIYTYRFDAPLYDPMGELVHEGGTYVYTVDVPTGASTLDIRPN